MAQSTRLRQPREGRFVTIETADGPVLHKRCSGPCAALKPVTDFYHMTRSPGIHSWCKACEKPGEQRRSKARHYPPYSAKRKITCVYVLQLLQRPHTIKIGRTVNLSDRCSKLRRSYGSIAKLLVIPIENPHLLEQQLHLRFQRFRLYEGTKQSELFDLSTKHAQEALKRLMKQYPDAVRTLPTWESRPAVAEIDYGQLGLW